MVQGQGSECAIVKSLGRETETDQVGTHCTCVPSAATPPMTSAHLLLSPLGCSARPVTPLEGADDEAVELALEVGDAEEEEAEELGEGPELSDLMMSAARSACRQPSLELLQESLGRKGQGKVR